MASHDAAPENPIGIATIGDGELVVELGHHKVRLFVRAGRKKYLINISRCHGRRERTASIYAPSNS